MSDRLKIVDCNRKAILALPNAAFKLWWCYYMSEDEEQESWMSIPEIMARTNLSRHSIVDWTDYLLRSGWLIDTGTTAADKWVAMGKQPTAGAYQVHVYRVDDPTTAKESLVENPNETEPTGEPVQNLHQCKNFTSAKIAPKVSIRFDGSYGCSSGSGGVCSSMSRVDCGSAHPTTATPENQEGKPENPKPKNPNPHASGGHGQGKYAGKTCWTHGLPLPCTECYRGRDISRKLEPGSVTTPERKDTLDDMDDSAIRNQSDPDFIVGSSAPTQTRQCTECGRMPNDPNTLPCWYCDDVD